MQSWMNQTERNILQELIEKYNPKTVLEIGTCEGASTLILASMGAKVATIDKNQVSGLGDNIYCVTGNSHDIEVITYAANILKSVDFIFIDGDHTKEGVYLDAINCYSLLFIPGIMVFHDIYNPEVIKGIDKFRKQYPPTSEMIYNTIPAIDPIQDVVWGGLRSLHYD